MRKGRFWAYGLIISLILGFGLSPAHAKKKRQKRIVQIKLEAPKKRVRKARPKRAKPIIVQYSQNQDVEVEPLKKNQKISNLGIKKEWSKKKRRKNKKRDFVSKAEKTEDETKLQNNDLNQILNNMKSNTETEFLTEYEGSF